MHALEEQYVVRHLVDAVLVEPEAAVRDGDETRVGVRATRSEERHVVALADELFGQIRDDALRAPVVLGRDALVQRSHLRDLQTLPSAAQPHEAGWSPSGAVASGAGG